MQIDHQQHPKFFHRLTDWIVLRPWMTILLLIVITGFASVGQFAPNWLDSLLRAPPEPSQQSNIVTEGNTERPPDVNPFSVSNANAVMIVESDELFSPRGAKMLRHVVQTLEDLDHVRSVVWMDRVPMLNILAYRSRFCPPRMPRKCGLITPRKRRWRIHWCSVSSCQTMPRQRYS